MFYYNFVDLCNKAGKSPSAAAEEMGFKRSVVTRWSKGTEPRQATLQRIAAYFGVSVSDLTEEKEKSPTPEGMELDAETMELREIWNTADQEEREALLAMAKMLKARRNK